MMFTQINITRFHRGCCVYLTGLVLLAVSGVSHATIIGGGSSSYGLGVNLVVNPLLLAPVSITVGPLPNASGSAPDPYAEYNSALTLSVTTGLLNLTTGLLETIAVSDIDGTGGDKFAFADAKVHGLGLNVLSGLLGLGIGLNTGEVESAAYISGDYGALNVGGGTSLANVSLNALLLSLGLGVDPAPNTQLDVLGLLGLLGLSVVLNEQIVTGDGISNRGVEVNAIHIGFHNFALGLGLINGDIIISHSEAWIEAKPNVIIIPRAPAVTVPEPGTLALEALAFAVLLRFRRRTTCAHQAFSR